METKCAKQVLRAAAAHIKVCCGMALPLLIISAIPKNCQYWPCVAPCPKNHKLMRDSLGTSWCQWCEWGFYSAAENTKATCEHCPANSIITQGRYSSKFNDDVGNWCEEDCGVALRHLIKYPIEHDKDFWGELYNPFRWNPDTKTGIECVRYSKQSKLSDCTEAHFKLADNMIVVNPGSYQGNAWLDYRTEVDTAGMQARRCEFCPTGKYIKKDSTKPRFQQIICEVCPAGMISRHFTDATFLPQDVKDMTTFYLGTVQFPAGIACKACSESEGVPNAAQGACQACPDNHYQHAEQIQVQGVGLIVGTKCMPCPPGYEYYNWKRKQTLRATMIPCRSADGVRDCCRLCLPNSYSTGEGTSCVQADENKGTLQPYGASDKIACGVGEELVYCNTAGVCQSGKQISSSRKTGWRTCRKCSESNIQVSTASNGVCLLCADEQKDLAEGSKCVACSSCHVLSSERITKIVYTIPQNMQDKVDMRNPNVAEIDYTYTQDVVTGVCSPLERRSIKQGTLVDADYYREKKQIQLVPDFYTLVRTTTNCTLTPCAQVCRAYFYYSPACGQQEKNLQSLWVLYENTLVLFSTLTAQQKSTEPLYVHHGPCQLCKTCPKGSYNGGCNVHVSGNDPLGSCRACLTQCAEGFFMHHPDKEAGCHAPPALHRSSNNLWKISNDYVCSPCPAWVRQDDRISIVTACGVRRAYTAWAWDENSRLIAQQLPVVWSDAEADKAELGDGYKNYRSFMRDLVPYCPASYFYDEQVAGCDLSLQESQSYRVPGTATRTVAIGFGEYNPECCKPCTTCPYVKKKDTSNWKACAGDSVKDTENACVDRCGAMYWENETARECRRCSTCDAGFL